MLPYLAAACCASPAGSRRAPTARSCARRSMPWRSTAATRTSARRSASTLPERMRGRQRLRGHDAGRPRRPEAAFRRSRPASTPRRTGRRPSGWASSRSCSTATTAAAGFSFDDMAADAAGVRFAAAFLAAPRADWPALLARIGSEADVLPALDGLPSGLSDAEFRAATATSTARPMPAWSRRSAAASTRCRSTARPSPTDPGIRVTASMLEVYADSLDLERVWNAYGIRMAPETVRIGSLKRRPAAGPCCQSGRRRSIPLASPEGGRMP